MTTKVYIDVFNTLSTNPYSYKNQTSSKKPIEKCALRSLEYIQKTLPSINFDTQSYIKLIGDIMTIHNNYMNSYRNSMCYICQLIDWIRAQIWQKTDRAKVEELYQALLPDLLNRANAANKPATIWRCSALLQTRAGQEK